MIKDRPVVFFLDIDGTLIGDGFTVSERNISAIEKTRAQGNFVFINTGRAMGNIPSEFFPFIDSLDGLIAGSGSYIKVGKNILLDASFSPFVLQKITERLSDDKRVWCVLEGRNRIIGLNDVPPEWGVKDFISGKNKAPELTDEPVEVIAIGKTVPEDLKNELSDDMHIIQMTNFADCLIPGCSKADGIKKVMEYLGVPQENSVAIGDSENDIEMFDEAGFSAAVKNASPTAKAAADIITAANTEDGVALVIESFLH